MTDRELLELAAKAAGINGKWMTKGEGDLWLFRGDFSDPWNPLTNNNDAFELSIQLGISIDHDYIQVGFIEFEGYKEGEYERGVNAWIVPMNTGKVLECSEVYGNDPVAATRRAIVKLAAEIGRNMA